MIWLSSLLKEPAVYWEPPVRDGYGSYVWGAPIAMDNTRWEPFTKLSTDDKSEFSQTRVWYQSKTRIVDTGGYLWEGSVTDLPNPKINPNDLENAFMVSSVESVSSLIAADAFLRKATLL